MKRMDETVTIDSPEYEKKSKSKFIIILICSLLAGAVLGFFMSFGTDIISELFAEKTASLIKTFKSIQLYVLPWFILLITIVCAISNSTLLTKSRQQIKNWDGEDDKYIAAIDKQLSHVLLISNICNIGINIFFAMITYNLFRNLKTKQNIAIIFITILFYFAGLIITVLQQNQTIQFMKEYAPEKKGSIYDPKFKEVWLDSCDEAERQLIGEVSYKTFQFMNKVLSTFLTATTILGMFCPIGFLCAVVVGIIWLLMTWYYSKEAIRLDKSLS